ncbi:Fe-S cluster assembly protein SufD [Bacteroidota bacterium]
MNKSADIIYNPEYFNSLFEENKQLIENRGNSIINNPRHDALASFNNLGIPTKKNENYKYTDLSSSFNVGYKYLFDPEKINFNVDDVFKCDVPELETEVVLLLNGFYFDRKNPLKKYSNGLVIGSLAKAAEELPHIVEKHYRKYAFDDKESLVALNTAFALDGIFIYVPRNLILDKPIQIINISLSENDLLIQHRNLFIIEENANAKIVVCDHSLSHKRFLTNQVAEVYAGNNAHLDFTRLQNEHLATTQISHSYVYQERDSNTIFNTVTLHGGVVRNNVIVKLMGEGCSNSTSGLYILDQGQHIDNYTLIEHLKPNCLSNQLFKGVLNDYSTGAFNGKIYVAKDAQKTEAYQSNNNILLTNDAKMNSKPQLEIYADDVKCSHGATVGQLDEDAMFYLRSRGIDEKEARLMLMNGFANDVIEQIKVEPLQERITELVTKRLRGELSRCNNCQMHCGQ